MKKLRFTTLFLLIFSNVFSQKMENLYKYVIENSYHRMLENKIIKGNDTLYYFTNGLNYKNKYIYNYKIEIQNPYIQLKMPKVNEERKHANGFMLLVPEIENQFIVISFVEYGVNYNGNNDSSLVNCGEISYYFTYSKERRKYIFIKRKEFSF